MILKIDGTRINFDNVVCYEDQGGRTYFNFTGLGSKVLKITVEEVDEMLKEGYHFIKEVRKYESVIDPSPVDGTSSDTAPSDLATQSSA